MGTDITLCAPSQCPRMNICKRALKPCQPVGPNQSVTDFYPVWGNICPYFGHKALNEAAGIETNLYTENNS